MRLRSINWFASVFMGCLAVGAVARAQEKPTVGEPSSPTEQTLPYLGEMVTPCDTHIFADTTSGNWRPFDCDETPKPPPDSEKTKPSQQTPSGAAQ